MPQTAKSREEMVLASIEPRGLPLREQGDKKKKKKSKTFLFTLCRPMSEGGGEEVSNSSLTALKTSLN